MDSNKFAWIICLALLPATLVSMCQDAGEPGIEERVRIEKQEEIEKQLRQQQEFYILEH